MASNADRPFAEFGQTIADLRENLGMTRSDLCEELGWNASHLSAVETGRRSVTVVQIADLSRALSVKEEDLSFLMHLQKGIDFPHAREHFAETKSRMLMNEDGLIYANVRVRLSYDPNKVPFPPKDWTTADWREFVSNPEAIITIESKEI